MQLELGGSQPPVVIEERGRLLVVRDDLVPGGTKARVLPQLMSTWPEEEFVFGGPAQGYAQLAGAISARAAGKRWTYFVAQRSSLHALTAQALEAGAKVVEVPAGRLSVVQARARAYCEATGARFLPLGFDVPEFGAELVRVLAPLSSALSPPEVWAVAGSGALSRALQQLWPAARHHAVRIGFQPAVGRAELHIAPERFDEEAEQPPPLPSCVNYDAKAWRFVEQLAAPGALWWNVAA